MSATVFCIIALVFLIRFDQGYRMIEDNSARNTFTFALVVAVIWDILMLIFS